MAKAPGVWGIEIGQSALKALRCKAVPEDPKRIEADAFDFIEYSQLLSEPGAEPDKLIDEAMQQFLSRNSLKGDRVAISVPGQLGLARFVKLPPIESKKIPDIVKFEAKQQIPFPLSEVIWDYQQLAGGNVEEGFALETEVGLFAMKRDQVYKQLEPFDRAKIEVDYIQLTPLALYNFCAYDQMPDLPPADKYDPENPPDWVAILSMGCESTDLVCTNGFRVWQRNIPMGGNTFTKVLMKEFDLTFAKAEHLKRNATTSNSPKAVFQAMKPVFAELVTQMQQSLAFFQNLNRTAKITRIIGLGNVMKLPGVRTYLQQNLGYDVEKIDAFPQMVGPTVLSSTQFKDNLLSFACCYGLCLQGLTDAKIRTNLVPQEIVLDRKIRDKKPWAVAAAAVLLVGLSLNSLGYWRQWRTVHDDVFKEATIAADQAANMARQQQTEFEAQRTALFERRLIGDRLVANKEGRLYWLEMVEALNACLPKDTPTAVEPGGDDSEEAWFKKIAARNQIYLRRIEAEQCDDLAAWYKLAKREEAGGTQNAAAEAEVDPNATVDPNADPNAPKADAGPTGKGWIIRLTGHHFHNVVGDSRNQGRPFVVDKFLSKLAKKRLTELSTGKERPVGDLGIGYPVLVAYTPIQWDWDPVVGQGYEPYPLTGGSGSGGAGFAMPGRNMGEGGMSGMPMAIPGEGGFGVPGGALPPGAVPKGPRKPVKLPRFDFQIQFAWQETPEAVRIQRRKAEEEAAKKALEEQQQNQGQPGAGGTTAQLQTPAERRF